MGRQCSVFVPVATRAVSLVCQGLKWHCSPVTAPLVLGGDFQSDYHGSKGLKCHCNRDAQGNLRAQQRRDPAQSRLICSGQPIFDWDKKGVSSCGGCQCHYV